MRHRIAKWLHRLAWNLDPLDISGFRVVVPSGVDPIIVRRLLAVDEFVRPVFSPEGE